MSHSALYTSNNKKSGEETYLEGFVGSLLAAIQIPDKPCPRFLRVSKVKRLIPQKLIQVSIALHYPTSSE